MAGHHCRLKPKGEARTEPGTEKCIILIYEASDAVRKSAMVLGI